MRRDATAGLGVGCALDTAFALASVAPQGTVVGQPPAPTGPGMAAGWTTGPPTCVDMTLGPSLVPGYGGTAPTGWAQAWGKTPQAFGGTPGGFGVATPPPQGPPAGDYAGTVTDPYTGVTYAAYTRAMPEPIIPRGGDMSLPAYGAGTAGGAAAAMALEALTGNSALTARPCRQEMTRDWADALEGARIPTALLQQTVNAAVAASAARDTYFTNREVAKPLPDTKWEGYIGTSYVLRVREDTQTVQDYDGGGTSRLPDRAPLADLTLPMPMPPDPTGLGGPMAPLRRILAQDKTTQPGRPVADGVEQPSARLSTAQDGRAGAREPLTARPGGRFGENLVAAGPGATSGLLPPQDSQDRGHDGVLGALRAMVALHAGQPTQAPPAQSLVAADGGGAAGWRSAAQAPLPVAAFAGTVAPGQVAGPATVASDGAGLRAGWQGALRADVSVPVLPGVEGLPSGPSSDGTTAWRRVAWEMTAPGAARPGGQLTGPAGDAAAVAAYGTRGQLQAPAQGAGPRGVGDQGLAVSTAPVGAFSLSAALPRYVHENLAGGPQSEGGVRPGVQDLGAGLRSTPVGVGATEGLPVTASAAASGLRDARALAALGGATQARVVSLPPIPAGGMGMAPEFALADGPGALTALGGSLRAGVHVGGVGSKGQLQEAPSSLQAAYQLAPEHTAPGAGTRAGVHLPHTSLTGQPGLAPEYGASLRPDAPGPALRVAQAQAQTPAHAVWASPAGPVTWDGSRAAARGAGADPGTQRVGPLQLQNASVPDGGAGFATVSDTAAGAAARHWLAPGASTRVSAGGSGAGPLATPLVPMSEGTRAARTYIGLGATTAAAQARNLFWADGPQGFAALTAHPSKDRGDRSDSTADKLLSHTSLLREVLLGAHPASGPGVHATYACPRETCAATLTNQATALWDRGAQAQTALLDAAIRQQQALSAAAGARPSTPLCDVGYESDLE